MTAILSNPQLQFSEANDLRSKGIFDSVEPINVKSTVGTVDLSRKSDAGASDMGSLDSPIITEVPNSYKRRGSSVSKNFIQLSRSDKTFNLLQKDAKAFLLLTFISLRCTRDYDPISELHEGECFISEKTTPSECGLSSKEYRGAKARLIKLGMIHEIFNPSWLKKSKEPKPRTDPELENYKKRATKRATKCCIVKLVELDIYDVNLKSKGDQKGDQRATKGRPKGDIQEGKEREEDKKKTTPLPPKGGLSDVPFSKKKSKEGEIHVHREAYMTESELQECIQVRGSLESVKEVIDNILDWPDRKYSIRDWPGNIKKWKLKNLFIDNRAANEQLGKTLENQFYYIKEGWCLRHYRDSMKDDVGILFECKGSAYSEGIFVSYSSQNFKQRVYEIIEQKKMKPKN